MTASALRPARWVARLVTWPQFIVPQRALTALAHRLARLRIDWLQQAFMRLFVVLFQVRLDEAENTDLTAYPHFDALFTRHLRRDARPLTGSADTWISPCDGTISQLGDIDHKTLIQAKGIDYRLDQLLGERDWTERLSNGRFLTIYLAPGDYHRVHMPMAGRLRFDQRIPGRLFSVSAATTRSIPGLFTRNERLVCGFDGPSGPFAVILVAAMLVAGIETVWDGPELLRPGQSATPNRRDGPELTRGQELGCFHYGSTVIVITPPDAPAWRTALAPGRRLRMGQALADPMVRES